MQGTNELCEILEKEFQEYIDACYNGQPIPELQKKEIRQAFFSGMHVLNNNRKLSKELMYEALKKLLLG